MSTPSPTPDVIGHGLPWWRLIAFAALFVALQSAWSAAQDGWLWRLWVEMLNVDVTVAAISALAPELGAYADGARIRAPGGGLNVLQGCDGAELLWLISAAFAVAPLPWRWRLGGWLAGLLLVWLLNIGRITALFFAWRHDAQWFDWLHNYIGPLALVVLLALYVQWIMQRAPRPQPDAPIGYL
jgi:exosortase/archaeosortase family protein